MVHELSDAEINSILDDISDDLDTTNWEIWKTIWTSVAASYYFKGQDIESLQIKRELSKKIDDTFLSKASSNDRAMKYFNEHGVELVKNLSNTDKNKLKKLIIDEFPNGKDIFIRKARDSFLVSDSRLETIYRTETHTAYEAARYEVEKDLMSENPKIKRKKEMHHSGNPNFRAEHLQADSEIRELDKVFSFGQLYPAAPRCTCYVTYFTE